VPGPDVLADLLIGHVSTPSMPRPPCAIVMGGPLFDSNIDELRSAIDRLAPGGLVAYIVRLDLPLVKRVLTIATLSRRLRRVERMMERAHVGIVGTFGIDPHLDAPVFVYQLNSPAADYADENLRPRGGARKVRRVVAYCCGYDLSLGAVVIMGTKR
jgi:hypothetical protein